MPKEARTITQRGKPKPKMKKKKKKKIVEEVVDGPSREEYEQEISDLRCKLEERVRQLRKVEASNQQLEGDILESKRQLDKILELEHIEEQRQHMALTRRRRELQDVQAKAERLQTKLMMEFEGCKEEASVRKRELDDRNEVLLKRLDELDSFKRGKMELEERKERLDQQLHNAQKDHQRTISDMMHHHVREKHELSKRLVEEYRQVSRELLIINESKMEAATRRTIHNNKLLTNMLAAQSEKTMELLKKDDTLRSASASHEQMHAALITEERKMRKRVAKVEKEYNQSMEELEVLSKQMESLEEQWKALQQLDQGDSPKPSTVMLTPRGRMDMERRLEQLKMERDRLQVVLSTVQQQPEDLVLEEVRVRAQAKDAQTMLTTNASALLDALQCAKTVDPLLQTASWKEGKEEEVVIIQQQVMHQMLQHILQACAPQSTASAIPPGLIHRLKAGPPPGSAAWRRGKARKSVAIQTSQISAALVMGPVRPWGKRAVDVVTGWRSLERRAGRQ